MRRKIKNVSNPRSRALVYTSALVAMAVYAVPKIPALEPGIQGTFSVVWILFTALALAANVYFLVGADKERSQMLEVQEMEAKKNTAEEPKTASIKRRAF